MQTSSDAIEQAVETLQRSFWRRGDFWIFVTIGLGGLLFSILAFLEARKAKRAATEAGRIVKLQTVTIELTEVTQKLDRIPPDIRFSEARDLLAEISRRLRRSISPFARDPALAEAITAARQALQTAHEALKTVRPADPAKEDEAPHAVYYAVEDEFATINNCVADLLGLFERETFDFGDDDAA